MAIKISSVQTGSLSSKAGIKSGEILLSINGQSIIDFIDFQFYSADVNLDLELMNVSGNKRKVRIIQDWKKPLGLELAEHKCRTCSNKCIFCFVDQMRPGIRETLYVKDDDPVMSFIHGNFITLTNLTERDYKRIFEQSLTPLYISVHTTNPKLHREMLNYPYDFDIKDSLARLSKHNIAFHTQIVLVPGWNDRVQLALTLNELSDGSFNTLSIGIVPVGLTKFRSGLHMINKFTKTDAENAIEIADEISIKNKFKEIYCSDEIFIQAEKEIPEHKYYGDYPQLENGIGMISLLRKNWKKNKKKFISFLKNMKQKLIFVTGKSAGNEIMSISDEINNLAGTNITRCVKINNNFLGETVTVSGLIAACDMFDQISVNNDEIVTLPGNILNIENFTIDNIHVDALKERFGGKLLVIHELFENWTFDSN